MEKIFSRVDPTCLLHLVYRSSEMDGRTDVAPEQEFLQLASLRMPRGQTFKPHKHIRCEKLTDIAQESWVVISGSVQCTFYDLDDQIIASPILLPGDVSMTFRGGHNYLILEDDTKVYEFKTGPYLGQKLDKVFI